MKSRVLNSAKGRGYHVIEVRYRVPCNTRGRLATLCPVQYFRSRICIRTPIQSHVYENVGVEKYHCRYFLARAS